MSSLFEHMPGSNNIGTTSTVKTSSKTGGGFTWIIIYGLVAVILILIYMMLSGYKLSFKMLDFRSNKHKTQADSHTFWVSGKSGIDNLRVTDDQLPSNMMNHYTLHFDLLITNTRNLNTIEGPYRHIFHRGSDELYNSLESGSAQALPPYGLPKRLNPGIFLDPNTNDILVFVDTKSTSGDIYRESARIVDIPLDKPLRITVSVNKKVLEVNLNCNLELTKVLAGDPKTVENDLYGICGPAAAVAAIQNIMVWPYAVTNESLRNFCPPTFPSFQPPVAKSCGAVSDEFSMPALPSMGDLTNPDKLKASVSSMVNNAKP
jgi:hypothetical protein